MRPRGGLTLDHILARLLLLPYPVPGSPSKEPNLIQFVSPQCVIPYNPLLESHFNW